MSTPTIVLVSSEGERFSVPRDLAFLSDLIKGQLEEKDDGEDFPLLEVDTECLKLAIEFMEHYKKDPMPAIQKPLKSANMAENVPAWYAAWVDRPMETIFKLILASNFLDIKPMLDLTAGKVASMVKGKSPEEVRKLFNIVNDFTPEEEAYAMEEYKLLMEAKD